MTIKIRHLIPEEKDVQKFIWEEVQKIEIDGEWIVLYFSPDDEFFNNLYPNNHGTYCIGYDPELDFIEIE